MTEDEKNKQAEDFVRRIKEQREDILTAFIAKYNCEPGEAIQVQQGNTWTVVRMDESQRKAVEQMVLAADVQEKFVADVELLLGTIALHEDLIDGLTPEPRAAYQRIVQLLNNRPPPTPKPNVITPRDGFRPQ